MDPWIEAVWRPFHTDYIGYLKRQLSAQLPDALYVQSEADVFVINDDAAWHGRRQTYRPDVSAFALTSDGPSVDRGGTVAATVDVPVRARVRRRPETQLHLSIRETTRGHRLVTAVELFRPTNKGDARDAAAYRDKRDAYLAASANVVEVDLLRTGQNLMDLDPADLPTEATTTYRVCVRFANPEIGDRAEYYPIGLRQPLPRLAVPLRAGDNDAVLDLQRALAELYVENRYAVQLDYDRPPVPPLSPADAAWAAERVAAIRAGEV